MKYILTFMGVLLLAWFLCSVFLKNENGNSLESRRITSVMKGIAILCVVMCHFSGTYGQGIRFFTPLGGIGVSMFLILSGYGLNESWKCSGPRTWWRKRILAVVIPYAVLQCILYWPFRNFNIQEFVLDVCCIRPKYGNGWYLSYLMLWYLIFWTVRRVTFLNRHRVKVFVVISIIMFFTTSPIRAEQSVAFLLGILLSEYAMLKDRVVSVKCIVGVLITGIVFLAIKQLPIVRSSPQVLYNFVELMIKTPCGLGIMGLACQLSQKVSMRMFEWIGMISYELYIIHGYVLWKMAINWRGMVTFITLSFGGAILFGLLFNRTKNLQRTILGI